MTKKKTSEPATPKATRKKTSKPNIATPDSSVLSRYSPTDGAHAHPDWVKKNFPTYVDSHAGHEATSVREFTHEGHSVKIFTTYRIEVDGKPVQGHFSVDEDGRVYTHATPFVTYASAIDLMKAVLDSYPESFSNSDGDDQVEHHNHGRRERS